MWIGCGWEKGDNGGPEVPAEGEGREKDGGRDDGLASTVRWQVS